MLLFLSASRSPAPGLSTPAAAAAALPAYEARRSPVCPGCRGGGGSRRPACGVASAHSVHGRAARWSSEALGASCDGCGNGGIPGIAGGRPMIAMLREEDVEEGEQTCR
eukprot:752858-Hanusia_phi.AAC.1